MADRLIALATSIGGVFAANSITINDVEFGQGVASASSCVASLTTSINQSYVATSPAPSPSTTDFYVGTVSIAGNFSLCAVGTDLKVTLLNSTNTAITNGSFSVAVIASGESAAPGTQVSADASQTIVITPSAQVLASDVRKITVTTE